MVIRLERVFQMDFRLNLGQGFMCGPAVCGMEWAELGAITAVSHFPWLPSQPGFIGNTWVGENGCRRSRCDTPNTKVRAEGLKWRSKSCVAQEELEIGFPGVLTTFSVTLRKTLWFGCRNSHPIKNHRVWKSSSWACWAAYWTPAIPAFQRWLESITISRSAWVIQQACG